MLKNSEYAKFKNYEKKIKSPFIIYADVERILVPQDNGKQNPKESWTNKYQKHIAWSYSYKLVCVNDKFSKPFKAYENKEYCSDAMKKYFNKKLVMTKGDNEDFKNSIRCWICDNYYVHNDVHITGKYRGSSHRDCNINITLNNKIPVVFHSLKNYDSDLIMQELGKFNLKRNVIPNGLGKYISFTINNKLIFIDSFPFLSSLSDSLVKNLNKDDIKYFSQEFDKNVLIIVKRKEFYCYKYMSDFEKIREQLPSKEKVCSSLTYSKNY